MRSVPRKPPFSGRIGRISPFGKRLTEAEYELERSKENLRLRLFFDRPDAEAARFFEFLDGLRGKTFEGLEIQSWERSTRGVLFRCRGRNIEVDLYRKPRGRIGGKSAYPSINKVFEDFFPR